MSKSKQMCVSLPASHWEWVEGEAERLACSAAQVIRTLVAREFQRREKGGSK